MGSPGARIVVAGAAGGDDARSYALLKNIVPDFPLCNKSFNQSYSGNDL
jgi:Ni,Fe-hydrogenase III large subunit